MNLNRNPLSSSILYYFIGLIVITILFFSFFEEVEITKINYISIFGTFTSIYGLIVAYLQILSVKKTSELMKNEVEKANKNTIKIISISDLSKAIKLVQEIQQYLLSDKTESAVIRLKDLKSILINLKYNDQLKFFTDKKDYKDSLGNISINITNLNNELLKIKSEISKSKIISDLEKVESQLGEFEGHLKFKKND